MGLCLGGFWCGPWHRSCRSPYSPLDLTLSKNRHGRFKGTSVFQEIFDDTVRQCITEGLVSGKHLSFEGVLPNSLALLCKQWYNEKRGRLPNKGDEFDL